MVCTANGFADCKRTTDCELTVSGFAFNADDLKLCVWGLVEVFCIFLVIFLNSGLGLEQPRLSKICDIFWGEHSREDELQLRAGLVQILFCSGLFVGIYNPKMLKHCK